MTRTSGERQHLRDQVEVDRGEERRLLGLAQLVLVEGGVVALHTGVHDGRAGERADVRLAAGIAIARRAGRRVRGAGRHGLVQPGGLVVQHVILPVRPADRAQPPLVRRAQAKFVLLVHVALGLVPGGARGEAGGLQRGIVYERARARRAVALVVVGKYTARVVRVVADLIDVAHQVAAGVDGLQIAELAVHRPGGALELVLVVGGVEQRDLERLQRRAIRGIGLLVEHSPCVHVLIGLGDQHVPIIAELVQRLGAYPLVGDGVDVVADHVGVIDGRAAGRNAEGGGVRAAAGRIGRSPAAPAEQAVAKSA